MAGLGGGGNGGCGGGSEEEEGGRCWVSPRRGGVGGWKLLSKEGGCRAYQQGGQPLWVGILEACNGEDGWTVVDLENAGDRLEILDAVRAEEEVEGEGGPRKITP